MNYDEDENRPEEGEEMLEVVDPVVIDDKFRGFRHSQIDCRCCGCSGTVLLFIFLSVTALLIYYIFIR